MNIFRHSPQSFFCFGDGAASTGGSAPPGSSPTPASPSPAPSSAPAPAGGAASTPAPDGSPGPSSPAAGATDTNDPFSGLDGSFDENDLDQITIAPGPAADAGPSATPGAAPAVPAPTAQPAPAAVPSPEPAPAAAAPGPAATSEPMSARALLDQTVDGFRANEAAMAQWASENLFKLSAADIAELETNSVEALPKLAGKVYAQLLSSTGNMMRNLIPQLISESIETTSTVKAKASEAIGEFYKTNSDLNEKDHGETVKTWAKSFRAANPKATRAQAIDFVARAVRIQHGLPMPGSPVPASPGRPAPFAPARPGGRPPVSAPENDPYAGLGMEFDNET